MKNKILLIDDEDGPREAWKLQLEEVLAEVGAEFEVDMVDADAFQAAVEALEKRQTSARSLQRADFAELPYCRIDEAAVLIVDYDLLHFNGIATGERIAYLSRCYSTCGIIVALNQYGDNRFDLTLRGDFHSFADLNIGGANLINKNLWGHERVPGFHPWSWFSILEAYERLEKNVAELEQDLLDAPILASLGFPEAVTNDLPRKTEEFLATRQQIDQVTFRQFVNDGLHGFRPKDLDVNDESLLRIAAARVTKWLEKGVLPGQDILVDAPHLVTRLPSLLEAKNLTDLAIWNQTTNRDAKNLGIKLDLIEGHQFKSSWLSRPAWFWQSLSSSEDVPEIADPFSIFSNEDFPDFVFCEDVSEFLPKVEAREFIADVPGPFTRRFVANPDLAEKYANLAGVAYEPQLRFALV